MGERSIETDTNCICFDTKSDESKGTLSMVALRLIFFPPNEGLLPSPELVGSSHLFYAGGQFVLYSVPHDHS